MDVSEVKFKIYEPAKPTGPFDSDAVWGRLTEPQRTVLDARFSGVTLESARGLLGGVSRERVRQVQRSADEDFEAELVIEYPQLDRVFSEQFNGRCLIGEDELLGPIVVGAHPAARAAALHSLGVSRLRLKGRTYNTWWTTMHAVAEQRLRTLAGEAPFGASLLGQHAARLNLPITACEQLLEAFGVIAAPAELGWLRRSRETRDIAFLWLSEYGEPAMASLVALACGVSEHTVRENMRRDSSFTQIKPDGTWAISEWPAAQQAPTYSSAVEVIVDLLKERGPIRLDDLFASAQKIYSVGTWRYKQTLSDGRVGRTPDGLYDLTERGAKPIEDTEPQRPSYMVESDNGRVVAVRLPVNHDVIRGSGININRWLTWRLGLRSAPSSRKFTVLDDPGQLIVVRRSSSTASISSLRTLAQDVGAAEGCTVVVIFYTDNDTARVRHVCEICPVDPA